MPNHAQNQILQRPLVAEWAIITVEFGVSSCSGQMCDGSTVLRSPSQPEYWLYFTFLQFFNDIWDRLKQIHWRFLSWHKPVESYISQRMILKFYNLMSVIDLTSFTEFKISADQTSSIYILWAPPEENRQIQSAQVVLWGCNLTAKLTLNTIWITKNCD